jgi:hypothetical protein
MLMEVEERPLSCCIEIAWEGVLQMPNAKYCPFEPGDGSRTSFRNAVVWKEGLKKMEKVKKKIYIYIYKVRPPLCLVVRVPGYKTRGQGSIADANRFSEK